MQRASNDSKPRGRIAGDTLPAPSAGGQIASFTFGDLMRVRDWRDVLETLIAR